MALKRLSRKKGWKLHLKVILTLVLLQGLIDKLYVYLYPAVNPIRATLIGATAFLVLSVPFLRKFINWHPKWAFLPIFVNAFLGALSVQAGIVSSKSTGSAVLHVGILMATYAVLVKVGKKRVE